METIKLNKKITKLDNTLLNVSNIKLHAKGIQFKMKNGYSHGLNAGDEILLLKRYNNKIISTYTVKIWGVIDDITFITYPIENKVLTIYSCDPQGNLYQIVKFNELHNITPKDIKKYELSNGSLKLNIDDNSKNVLTNIKNVTIYSEIYKETTISEELDFNSLYVQMPNENYKITTSVSLPFNEFLYRKDKEYLLFDGVELRKNNLYYTLPISFTKDIDNNSLYQEENLISNYYNNIKDSLIPDIINMEKVKYKPIGNNGDYIETLIFNLHFRERVMENSNTPSKEWYIPENSQSYWNTIKSPSEITESNKNVYKSDLLGYLGFNESDVINQKMKIKKSFLRLSFYDSKDPISQNLLFYSTIFMDTGLLYGKFLRCLKDNHAFNLFSENDDENMRLSSQFIVTDEYNIMRSSEGYNLYLYEDDVPEKNKEKDIYLKIEFNHAGYGRTIPFILWNTKYIGEDGLTMDNYLDCLYIKVKIKYTDNGYTYNIPDVDYKDNILTFNLFEPRLEMNK